MWNLIKSLPLAVVLPVTLAMASVGPDDAQSNISKWLHLFGVQDLPHWLSAKAGDKYALAGALVFSLIYAIVVWVIPAKRKKSAIPDILEPNMPVHEAADYIVNDSQAQFRDAPLDYNNLPGVQWVGEQHGDALEQLRQKVGHGALRSWGRKQIGEPSAMSFDTTLHEIPCTYWDTADFNWLFCRHKSDEPQTCRLGGRGDALPYKQLTFNRSQVMAIWPRKPIWRRIAERWSKTERIKAWL